MAAVSVETRRAPRLPAKCPAEVAFGAGRWTGLTEDLGQGGCRIVARFALRPGEPISLRLRFAGVALDVVGTVAWSARRAPWHAGVAFARGQEDKARRFVKAVLAAAPELGADPDAGGFRGRPAPPPTLREARARVRALLLSARSQGAAGNDREAVHLLRGALEIMPGHPEVLAELKHLGIEEG